MVRDIPSFTTLHQTECVLTLGLPLWRKLGVPRSKQHSDQHNKLLVQVQAEEAEGIGDITGASCFINEHTNQIQN